MAKKHRYTAEQIEYLGSICAGKTNAEITELFVKNTGINVTPRSISGIMNRNGLKSGLQGHGGKDTQFKKGHTSWSKGMKGLNNGGEAGWFKKGDTHYGALPVGSESVKEGEVWVKIAQPSKWVRKHLHIWREAHGEIPAGMVIRFKDGDKMKVELDNLFMIPHRVQTSVVRRGIDSNDPDIKVATHNLAAVELAISDRMKELK